MTVVWHEAQDRAWGLPDFWAEVVNSASTLTFERAGVDARHAEEVETFGRLTAACDALTWRHVAWARRAGCTWTEIGAALGVSRQAVSRRFANVDVGEVADDAEAASDRYGEAVLIFEEDLLDALGLIVSPELDALFADRMMAESFLSDLANAGFDEYLDQVVSWAEMGRRLGISRQAAWKRYSGGEPRNPRIGRRARPSSAQRHA